MGDNQPYMDVPEEWVEEVATGQISTAEFQERLRTLPAQVNLPE